MPFRDASNGGKQPTPERSAAEEPREGAKRAPRTTSDLEIPLRASSLSQLLRLQDKLEQHIRQRFHRQLAVLFTDLEGSTAYFERFGDAAGRRMIQRHADLVASVVRWTGGRIIKTIGDSVMASFGSPSAAIEGAAELQRAVFDLNRGAHAEDERLAVRIGVNYGPCLVNESDGDVYGDMVNVAARIARQAAPGTIYISDELRTELPPSIPVRLAGRFELKGKSSEALLFEVLWREILFPRSDARAEAATPLLLPAVASAPVTSPGVRRARAAAWLAAAALLIAGSAMAGHVLGQKTPPRPPVAKRAP